MLLALPVPAARVPPWLLSFITRDDISNPPLVGMVSVIVSAAPPGEYVVPPEIVTVKFVLLLVKEP